MGQCLTRLISWWQGHRRPRHPSADQFTKGGLRIGDRVHIVSGPLTGLNGSVDQNDRESLGIWVRLDGGPPAVPYAVLFAVSELGPLDVLDRLADEI